MPDATHSFDWPASFPRLRSSRALEIAQRFGLRAADASSAPRRRRAAVPQLSARGITLLSGPSGSGKSTLLRALAREARHQGRPIIDVAEIPVPRRACVVDCFGDLCVDDALRLLCRVGLAETWIWLRRAQALSDGQRWRLRLAMALHRAQRAGATARASALLVCDEFAALLDRVTAIGVARSLRHAVDSNLLGNRSALAALVATSHDDLARSLVPDVLAQCDFGTVQWTIRAGGPR